MTYKVILPAFLYLNRSPGRVAPHGGRHRDVKRVRQLLLILVADGREKSSSSVLIVITAEIGYMAITYVAKFPCSQFIKVVGFNFKQGTKVLRPFQLKGHNLIGQNCPRRARISDF